MARLACLLAIVAIMGVWTVGASQPSAEQGAGTAENRTSRVVSSPHLDTQWTELATQLSSLPIDRRREVVLDIEMALGESRAQRPKPSSEGIRGAIAVDYFEHVLLSLVAREADWEELAVVHEMTAASLLSMLEGGHSDVNGAATLEGLRKERFALLETAIRSPRGPAAKLAGAFAEFIVVAAKEEVRRASE